MELQKFATENQLRAATILSGVGSVKEVSIRYANQELPTKLTGYYEIVSLQGTLALDSMHTHISVADKSGTTVGGHLMDGTLVYTTCEIVLLEQLDFEFTRKPDATTGYKELIIQPR